MRPAAAAVLLLPLLVALLGAAAAAALASDSNAPAGSPPSAAAGAAPVFLPPQRPSRPPAGALEHTPTTVPTRRAAAAAAAESSAQQGRTTPGAAGGGSARGGASLSASTAPRPSRRFQHSAIVAPSGRTVSEREAWEEARATRAAHRARRGAGGAARGASATGRTDPGAEPKAADPDADSHGDAESPAFTAANFTLPFDDPLALHAHAALLARDGFTVLHYDVSLRGEARLLDEDLNVLSVECAVRPPSGADPNATLALRLTVADASAALAEYEPGAVLHGSQMWGCRNDTILGRVHNATLVDAHTVALLLSHAGYEQLFEEAEILFQQPSLSAAEAEAQAGQQQQQGGASDPAATVAATGGGPMRRMLALPASTGTLPFDLPDSAAAQSDPSERLSGLSRRPAGVAPLTIVGARSREFHSLGNFDNPDLFTWIKYAGDMRSPSSTLTLEVKPSMVVQGNKWRVWLKRSDTDFGVVTVIQACTPNEWCDLLIDLKRWSNIDSNVQPSVLGYYFKVMVRHDTPRAHATNAGSTGGFTGCK